MDEESIFSEAREKGSDAERAAFLDEACRGNAKLRAEVEELLRASDQASRFLESPALDLAATTDQRPISERPGTVIGPYKLMEQIGEGGFGLVFVAEQQHPVRRKVALKVIKPGMDTREVIARFEAERQALALMDHPNIARVFDAGATDSGRPYFVMELVRGVPITEYCDQQHLTPRERLGLFVSLCHAIQHAHQKGIIHRDVKPTNVLVTEHDGRPVVKVIDFGVAKALSQQLTQRTIYTQFAQMIGTPLYMSPEQAAMSGLDTDTRSDIYSLGVLLYELLTGSTPFDRKRLQQAAADEIRRIIREEEPPIPSTRLSQSGERLPSIAASRHLEPQKLTRLVRGELDWIVMKALEKDRNRRYETASGLASDVERYLGNEPVQAGPPSPVYRLRKLARRHFVTLSVAGAFAMLLVLASVVSTWQAVRATRAEQQVIRERDQAMAEKEQKELALKEKLVALDRAREAEQQVIRERDQAIAEKEQKELALKEKLVALDRARAAEEGAQHASVIAQQNEQTAKTESAKSSQVAAFMKDMLQGVAPSVALGRDTTMLREILERTENRVGGELQEQPAVEAELRDTIGQAYAALGLYAKASEMHRQALALRTKLRGRENLETAASLNNLGYALWRQGFAAEGETSLREALAIRQRLLGEEHPEVAQSMFDLANVLWYRGRLAESETMHRQALAMRRKLLGNEHPDVGVSLIQLGWVLTKQRLNNEAETCYREALAIQRKQFGQDHPDIAWSLCGLAIALQGQGKLDDAVAVHRDALAMRVKLLGDHHPDVSNSLDNLARVLEQQGKLAEAEAAFRHAYEIQKDLRGQLGAPYSLGSLVSVLRQEGKTAEADILDRDLLLRNINNGLYLESLPMAARAGNEWIDRLIAKASTQDIQRLNRPTDAVIVGELRLVAGEVDSAVAAMRTCIALGHKEVYLYKSLGWALLAQGEHDEAKRAFQLALKSRHMADGTFKLEGADPDSLTAAYFLDLVTKDEYVDRFKDDKKLACFPWFYVGQRKEIEGDKLGAIAAYEKCVEAGSRDTAHTVRGLAQWRLHKLRP